MHWKQVGASQQFILVPSGVLESFSGNFQKQWVFGNRLKFPEILRDTAE